MENQSYMRNLKMNLVVACKLLQGKKKKRIFKELEGSNRWRIWWNRSSSSTSFLVSQTQSFHKLLIPRRACSSCCCVNNGLLVTDMICRKPVFQTELDPTIFASKVVRKSQNLSATLYRADWLLFLLWVTISGFFVFLKQRFDSFFVETSCLNRDRTRFTDWNRSVSLIWFWTIVRLIWSMVQTKHLTTDKNQSRNHSIERFFEKKKLWFFFFRKFTSLQPSQVKGRKSRSLQSGFWQCSPRSGNASVPPPPIASSSSSSISYV